MRAKMKILAISFAFAALAAALCICSISNDQSDSSVTLGDQVTDAPTTINVNTQYGYTPNIADANHPMHVLNNLVLKNLKTGETSASINYELPSWLYLHIETKLEYSEYTPGVILEKVKSISFSGTPVTPGTYNPKITLTTLNGAFVKEWQWRIEVSVTGSESMKVTFYSMQGGDTLDYTLSSPFSLTFPSSDVFSREGYTLSGWAGGLYECGQIVQLDYKPEGYTFYAHWVRNEDVPDPAENYKVTFNDGGSIKVVSVADGQKVSRPTVVSTKTDGTALRGWYTASNGGNEWDFNNSVSSDMTLYARYVDHFELKSDGLKATLLINSGWSGYQHKIYWTAGTDGESIGYSSLKTHDYDKTGKYTVKVVSTKGDQSATSTLTINVSAGGSSHGQGGDDNNDQNENQHSTVKLALGMIIAVIVAVAVYYFIDDELIAMIVAAVVIVIYYSALFVGVI